MKNIALQEPKPILTVNKWKFIIWLFIVTIIMFFAAFTSAYLVRRAEGNWVEFQIPVIFYYSTGILILSSVFMHLSYLATKKDDFVKLKMFISLTFGFGLLFLVMQYLGWLDLQSQGIFLKGNPSGSFYYVLTGLHGFHLITGLGVLLYSFIASIKIALHSKNMTQIEVCATYWHFLDILWVYLFLFLLFFR
ncbi:MAG: cytochrome c oxidase subunit 3 [Cytophagaceae bacterium]|nr:cytochrome c oxidase subunit 3 [Cytophagaceae bacterium]MBK9509380.1 cytochrome c oxidase subunit 3 [Cytophagaceae bacterium]MBK9935195.1 cytochrome c oxidase subunit 3 [Cytophagaceae bacterium]MBL0301638.1 cytochrome c oxidase subunit 3 [Cytophagaceae bacterium]MBL0324463.1 cytochrome c oxidase subunit 3 [Cytophagaceae bacterium]